MREIKFRAWGKNSKEFILADEQQGLTLKNIQALADLDSWELMQYTGLKDKNDKEIFEGDIVLWPNYHGEPKPCKNCGFVEHETKDLICEVKFEDGRTVHTGNEWSDDGLAELEPDEAPRIEVIGNIYENPELLA